MPLVVNTSWKAIGKITERLEDVQTAGPEDLVENARVSQDWAKMFQTRGGNDRNAGNKSLSEPSDERR